MESVIKQDVIVKRSRLIQGDCLEVMDELIREGIKVDAIITDPPYQTTACAGDTLIPFNKHIMLRKRSASKTPVLYATPK